MGNAISSFLFPDFKPVHGSENLNTGRPLTLERIAAESREPKNAANWDVHYFKKICHELGIKMDDILNAEAPLSDDKQFILKYLDKLPSTHLVKMPSHSISTYRPINEAKQIILSQHSFSSLRNPLNFSLILEKLDKKYILVNAAIALSLALLNARFALHLGISPSVILLFVGLTALQNGLFLYEACLRNYYNSIPKEQFFSRYPNTEIDFGLKILSTISFLVRTILLISSSTTPLGFLLYLFYTAAELSMIIYVASFHLVDIRKSLLHWLHLENLIQNESIHFDIHSIEKNTKKLINKNKKSFIHIFTDQNDSILTSLNNAAIAATVTTTIIATITAYGCNISVAEFCMKYLLSLSACAGLYLSVAGIFFVGAFAYAQNLNHFQKDYEKFFKNISSTPSFPSQVSNESITNEKYKVFEFALPYLSRTDKENVKLCSRELNDCVKENDDVFEVNSSNINQVTEAFPVEKIRINSLFSSSQEINESLSRLKRLTAIEMNLSISRSVNIWEINSTIRQKITHLTCYEQQIINLPSDERLIYFPQLTHLTIIDPTGEENSRRNNFICIRTGLPVLRCLVLKQSSENIYNPFSPELKLECPDALTELKLIGLENVRELPNFPRNLAFLFISNLSNVKAIPDLYRYKNLRSLTLRNLPRLQCIAGLLTYCYNYKLRSLTLRNLPQLQCIPSFLRDYYNLSSLTLCNLPQLQAAPELPRNLDHIFLHDIGKLNITVRSI